MTRPLIYIAGPYTHPDPVANTHAAIHESAGADAEVAAFRGPVFFWPKARAGELRRWINERAQ